MNGFEFYIAAITRIIEFEHQFNSQGSVTLKDVAIKTHNYPDKQGIALKDKLSEDEVYQIIESVMERLELSSNIETDQVSRNPSSLFDPSDHIEWKPIKNGKYWKKHKAHLISIGKFKPTVLKDIDAHTDQIISMIEDPKREKFKTKGLVLGHVQSGKTSNYSVLISKAADQGYRFIIVLAGMHTILRKQTQLRIDKEITGYNDLGLNEDFIEWNDYENSFRWQCLTKICSSINKPHEDGEFNDFIRNFDDVFENSKNRPVICVIKKNNKVLNKFLSWISTSRNSLLNELPVLIIDDEADQASVNARQNKVNDPTDINVSIRALINRFSRTCYIGYTATPYANILQKEESSAEYFEDLFPSNFIHPLPEPKDYFGLNAIYNKESSLVEHFVKLVPNANKKNGKELSSLLKNKEITPSLINAIWDFLFSVAFKSLRRMKNTPMSMMVNVSHTRNHMGKMFELIDEYLNQSINLNTFHEEDDLRGFFYDFCERCNMLNEKLGISSNEIFSWSSVCSEIKSLLENNEIEIVQLKSEGDELDYINNPTLKVIAIGGYKLSRGLTLEGLMTSFYLRNSGQSDSIYQMGRWFGFRGGYEDLVRIYSNSDSWHKFEDLVKIDRDLRNQLDEMIELELSPKEFSLNISYFKGQIPTQKGKMGGAMRISSPNMNEYSLLHIPLDDFELIENNFKNTLCLHKEILNFDKKLIADNQNSFGSICYKDIPREYTLDFLNNFNYGYDQSNKAAYDSFNYDKLTELINKNKSNWNIVFCSLKNKSSAQNEINLNNVEKITTVGRNRERDIRGGNLYYIRALSNPVDRNFALDVNSANPTLLIYFLSPNYSSSRSQDLVGIYSHKNPMPNVIPTLFTISFPSDYSDIKSVYQNKRGKIYG